MNEPSTIHPTRATIEREAIALEVFFDTSNTDALWLCKGNLFFACTQDGFEGRTRALEWLAQLRRCMEERDVLRSRDPLPRRRIHLRWLWRREAL